MKVNEEVASPSKWGGGGSCLVTLALTKKLELFKNYFISQALPWSQLFWTVRSVLYFVIL
jgi:hypothetical protein